MTRSPSPAPGDPCPAFPVGHPLLGISSAWNRMMCDLSCPHSRHLILRFPREHFSTPCLFCED